MTDRAFPFPRANDRQVKPRTRGLTEIRGPYYTPMGKRYLEDVLDTMGEYIDSLKFAGGSFTFMPRCTLAELVELCHKHDVMVSTGGFMESVLPQGTAAVKAYIQECRKVGFDIVEISSGFITIPPDDWLRLVEAVQRSGLKAKPEVGIQFGAGGATRAESLEAQGTRDPESCIALARRFLEAGAYLVMIESEGITENVKSWRTDVPADALGLENVMFEAADPEVFSWYVRTYGAEVNLFVDHSQIVQLECLRSGIWGTAETRGARVDLQRRGGAMKGTSEKEAHARIAYASVAPEALRAMYAVENYVRACGLERPLLELVKLRASQINGCAYCVDMHTKDGRALGESEQRLHAVVVWREAPFFTDRERAALAWTEAVTLVSRDQFPDEVYDRARAVAGTYQPASGKEPAR